MPFPSSFKGAFTLPTRGAVAAEQALARAEAALNPLFGKVRVEGATLRATSGVLGGLATAAPRSHPLAVASGVDLRVRDLPGGVEVAYVVRMGSTAAVVAALCLAAGVYGGGVLWGAGLPGVLGVAVGAWLWLFGMNYLVAMARASAWLQRELAPTPHPPPAKRGVLG